MFLQIGPACDHIGTAFGEAMKRRMWPVRHDRSISDRKAASAEPKARLAQPTRRTPKYKNKRAAGISSGANGLSFASVTCGSGGP